MNIPRPPRSTESSDVDSASFQDILDAFKTLPIDLSAPKCILLQAQDISFDYDRLDVLVAMNLNGVKNFSSTYVDAFRILMPWQGCAIRFRSDTPDQYIDSLLRGVRKDRRQRVFLSRLPTFPTNDLLTSAANQVRLTAASRHSPTRLHFNLADITTQIMQSYCDTLPNTSSGILDLARAWSAFWNNLSDVKHLMPTTTRYLSLSSTSDSSSASEA